MESHPLTVHLSPDVDEQLDRIAERTEQPKSELAAAAVKDYVAREAEIVASLQRALEDAKAGRVTPHEEVMRRMDKKIAEARARQTAE